MHHDHDLLDPDSPSRRERRRAWRAAWRARRAEWRMRHRDDWAGHFDIWGPRDDGPSELRLRLQGMLYQLDAITSRVVKLEDQAIAGDVRLSREINRLRG